MLYKQHLSSDYRWGIWKVTESLEELLALLPDRGAIYSDDLAAFTSDSRKTEWLAVRVLVYSLIGEIIPICYQPNGKPYFAVGSAHLSISHTKGYVAVILSSAYEVGIDIEKVSERIHKVAHKFVREDENPHREEGQYTHALLLIWSAKETLFKCMNQEAVDFRKHLYVDVPLMQASQFTAREFRTAHKRSYLIHFILHPDFVMTWTMY